MKRGLPADFVMTQASAHSVPTSGKEYKVVNWLRAAAIIARLIRSREDTCSTTATVSCGCRRSGS